MTPSTKPRSNGLPTGRAGADEVLGGGLPEFSFNVIAGPPGCGKTTLAHQMMFALATPERPALYFTVLGEPPLKMLRYQQQFDFFDSAKVNACVRFVNLSEETATGDLKKVLARIVAEVERTSPGLVFVDSFRSVALAQDSGQVVHRPAGIRAAAGHDDDELAGHHLPDRRVLHRERPEPGLHRGRWPDLAAPERGAQLRRAQDGDHEDARAGHAAGAAHVPHQRGTGSTCSRRRNSPIRRTAQRMPRPDSPAAHGRSRPGRDDGRRPAARLLAADRRPDGRGQEHPGFGLPGRGRAQRRDRRHRGLRAAPQPVARPRSWPNSSPAAASAWSTPGRPGCRWTRSRRC